MVVDHSTEQYPLSLLTHTLYCWFASWLENVASLVLSVVFQLKLETLPEMPVKYCKQPSGALSTPEQENWVILIFHCLDNPVT